MGDNTVRLAARWYAIQSDVPGKIGPGIALCSNSGSDAAIGDSGGDNGGMGPT